jgi:lysophospholipase L1-like esterase
MRFALLAGSSVLGLFGAELFVRAFVSVRDVGPPLTEYDPVCGQRLKRSFQCVRETPEFRMHFSSNSMGWRGPEPATPKAEIVFLGDSFTMGYGVDDGQEFPQLLAGALGASVVNMGLGGTGHGRWPLILRNAAPAFDPEIVVLQLCSNDVEDDVTEGLASLDARGALVHHVPSPPSAGRHLQEIFAVLPWVGDSHLVGLLRQFRIRGARSAASVLPSTDSSGLALALALFEESIDLCVERKWRVVVLSADLNLVEAVPFAEVCQREGVPFVRMPSKPEAPELYFAVDGHWNEAGHRRAAALLEPWLRRDGPL